MPYREDFQKLRDFPDFKDQFLVGIYSFVVNFR